MSQFDDSLSFRERIDRIRFACMGWYDEKVSRYQRFKENFRGWLTFQSQHATRERPQFRDKAAGIGRAICSFSKALYFGSISFLLRLGCLATEIRDHLTHCFRWIAEIPVRRRIRAELAREVQTALKQLERENFVPSPSEDAVPEYTFAEIAPRVVLHYGKIAAASVMVAGVSFLIYIVAQPNNPRIVSNSIAAIDEMADETESSFQRLVLNKDLDPGNGRLIEPAAARSNIESLEQISIDYSLSESEQDELTDLLIKNWAVVVQQYIAQGLDCQAEKKQLLELCRKCASESKDQNSIAKAEFWMFAVDAIHFANAPNEEGFRQFTASYSQYPEVCRTRVEQARKIFNLLNLMSTKFRKNEFTKKAADFYSNAISQSDSPEILQLAANMRDLSIFVELDVDTLAKRISWGAMSATDDMQNAIELLTSNPASTTSTWEKIILANESFLAYSRFKLFHGVRNMLSEAVNDLPESEKKTALISCLARQQQRLDVMGKKIESLGTSMADAQAITPKRGSYKLIVFADADDRSTEDIGKLKRTAVFVPKLHSVLAYVNSDDPAVSESTDNLDNVSVASRKTSSKLFELIPIDSYPYTLLLDESNEIVAVNVAVGEIENRLAKLQRKSRKEDKTKMQLSSLANE